MENAPKVEGTSCGTSALSAGFATVPPAPTIACPKCKREWKPPCEQTRCIAKHGECICCRFIPIGAINKHGRASGTREEFDAIGAKNKAANVEFRPTHAASSREVAPGTEG